jgi:hypothetical protein
MEAEENEGHFDRRRRTASAANDGIATVRRDLAVLG